VPAHRRDALRAVLTMKFRMRGRHGHAVTLVLLLLGLAGCASWGASDIPVLRSFGWFNYLDGKDLRDNCGPGSGERYRLIYNAVWGEQVRVYEIAAEGGSGGTFNARVMFPEWLSEVDLRDPLRLYRGSTGSIPLSAAELAEFRAALRASDFDSPAPRGLTLPSDGFYWVVAACREGIYHFNAYAYPSPRFDEIRFYRWLFKHDPNGIAASRSARTGWPVSPRSSERRPPYSALHNPCLTR
jgi:hypothetical protein